MRKSDRPRPSGYVAWLTKRIYDTSATEGFLKLFVGGNRDSDLQRRGFFAEFLLSRYMT